MHVVYNTWLTPVTACGSQSTACGIEMRRGQPGIGVNFIFAAKMNKKYSFQIKLNKMISQYKTMHILLANVHLDWGGGGGGVPVTKMLARMNLSKPDMNLSKPGMNLSNPGEKHNNHVIITNLFQLLFQFINPVTFYGSRNITF